MNQGRSEREVIEVGHINSHLQSQPLDMEAGRPVWATSDTVSAFKYV